MAGQMCRQFFDIFLKLTAADLKPVDNMTEAEFHEELEKGYADYLAGKGRSAKDVFTDIRKELNP